MNPRYKKYFFRINIKVPKNEEIIKNLKEQIKILTKSKNDEIKEKKALT